MSDLTSATACSGFFAGNLNSNNSGDVADQKAALASIGFDWDGNFKTVEKIDLSDKSFNIDFSTKLTDTSFVSIHWGAGQGPVKAKGGTTGFYKIESNSPLNILVSAFGSLSNAVLYKTAIPIPIPDGGGGGGGGLDPVPEPGVWLQMIAGFGLVGAVRRRQQRAIAA